MTRCPMQEPRMIVATEKRRVFNAFTRRLYRDHVESDVRGWVGLKEPDDRHPHVALSEGC